MGILNTLGKWSSQLDMIGGRESLMGAAAFVEATGNSAVKTIGMTAAAGTAIGAGMGFLDDTGTIGGAVGGGVTGLLSSAAVVGGAIMTKSGRSMVNALGKTNAKEFDAGMKVHEKEIQGMFGKGDVIGAASYAYNAKRLKQGSMVSPVNGAAAPTGATAASVVPPSTDIAQRVPFKRQVQGRSTPKILR